MTQQIISPVDVLCRELRRLNNDVDRLQMLITLKSHLHHVQFTPATLQLFFSIFTKEQYRLQALRHLIPFIHPCITVDSLSALLKLFTRSESRSNLIEILQTDESLKTKPELIGVLDDESRNRLCRKKIQPKETAQSETDHPPCTTSDVTKVASSTSGVFEKAKQFVCRVFGGANNSTASLDTHLSRKRSIDEVHSFADDKQRKFHQTALDDLQFQPTPISLSTSHSYTSIPTRSPPPSPIDPTPTRQSSMSFHVDPSSLPMQSMMVTQIHSILDNIDSVLDKIEAQTNSIARRPSAFNENHPAVTTSSTRHLDASPPEQTQQSIDQITQTVLNIVERHVHMNDGSGDTTSALIDLIEESNSVISSEDNDETSDSLH